MAITNKAWNGDPSRWPDAKSYCDCCLINCSTSDNPADWSKSDGKLPICEPNGDLNTNACAAACAALCGARGGIKGVSPADKKAAARKLIKAYGDAKMDPPPSLKNIAGK